jgi:hypothetical protein
MVVSDHFAVVAPDRRGRPGEGIGPLRASLYHLARRTDLPAWREAVAASPIEDARLTVTGPWPSYAFAEETPA